MTEWLDRCHFGDCLESLRRMPAGFVNTCVTSPPYYGLRDYGTGTWEGGAASCEHKPSGGSPDPKNPSSTARNGKPSASDAAIQRGQCHCGAVRVDRQIGLEDTPEEFIARLVDVFREVRRVLRDDGTCWVNMGDTYAQGGRGQEGAACTLDGNTGRNRDASLNALSQLGGRIGGNGLKTKDLIGVPWMLAFALRADGWYLRQDIIWSKPNPMPESVTDRCTKSHEYIFLLSKSPSYFCDMEGISEVVAQGTVDRLAQCVEEQAGSDRVPGKTNGPMKALPPRFGGQKYGDSTDPMHQTKSGNVYTGARAKRDGFVRGDTKGEAAVPGQQAKQHRSDREEAGYEVGRRNKRSVWFVSTKPYKGAHFATFPPDLIEPCVLAGAPAGGVVLDPFFGSGTTGEVAQRLGRRFVGCELNVDYHALQQQRLTGKTLGLELAA